MVEAKLKWQIFGSISAEMVQSSPPVAFMTGMCVRAQRGEEIRNKVQGCQDKGAFNACSVRGIIEASLNAKISPHIRA